MGGGIDDHSLGGAGDDRPLEGVANWNGPYLKKSAPKDPWGNPYKYRCCPGQHGDYDLWSEGADGAPGGEGENTDIVSWDVEKR